MAKNCRREMGWGRGTLDNLPAMPHKVLRSFVDTNVRSGGRGQVPAAFEGAGVGRCVALGGRLRGVQDAFWPEAVRPCREHGAREGVASRRGGPGKRGRPDGVDILQSDVMLGGAQ